MKSQLGQSSCTLIATVKMIKKHSIDRWLRIYAREHLFCYLLTFKKSVANTNTRESDVFNFVQLKCLIFKALKQPK